MTEPILQEPLETVQATRACPITQTTDACVVTNTARDGSRLRNIINRASGLVYVDPLPIHDLRTFYTTDYRREYKASPQPSRRRVLRAGSSALERFARIRPHLPAGRTLHSLDVGASSGEFVMLLMQAGINAKGCEPNESFAAFAREQLQANVAQGMIADLALVPSSLDVVTLFHVVEHLENPVETLSEFRRALRPDGVLVVEVPNILSANMGFRHKWHKGHLFGFSKETLAAVARVAGFDTVELGATGQDHNVWLVARPSKHQESAPPMNHHFEVAVTQLRANACANYLLQARPWVAAVRKSGRALAELRAYVQGSPRTMLQSLYRRGLALQSGK